MLPTVSDFENDGWEVIAGPPLSSDVEEEVFRGAEVPGPDFDGWLPMSRELYPRDSA